MHAGVGLGEWIEWDGDRKRAHHFLTGFVRVLENLESPGNLVNSDMKCMEGSKEN